MPNRDLPIASSLTTMPAARIQCPTQSLARRMASEQNVRVSWPGSLADSPQDLNVLEDLLSERTPQLVFSMSQLPRYVL